VALELVLASTRQYEPWNEPVGGSVAVRFKGTRRYVWAGLGIDFANAVCDLVNGGSLWLVPPGCLEYDEDHWTVDLPAEGDGDVWERWVLSVCPDHRGEASTGILEAVSKPGMRLVDAEWQSQQEAVLESLTDWDALGLETPAEKAEWVSRLAERVADLQRTVKPVRRRKSLN
jgi:hypothetical protein